MENNLFNELPVDNKIVESEIINKINNIKKNCLKIEFQKNDVEFLKLCEEKLCYMTEYLKSKRISLIRYNHQLSKFNINKIHEFLKNDIINYIKQFYGNFISVQRYIYSNVYYKFVKWDKRIKLMLFKYNVLSKINIENNSFKINYSKQEKIKFLLMLYYKLIKVTNSELDKFIYYLLSPEFNRFYGFNIKDKYFSYDTSIDFYNDSEYCAKCINFIDKKINNIKLKKINTEINLDNKILKEIFEKTSGFSELNISNLNNCLKLNSLLESNTGTKNLLTENIINYILNIKKRNI